MLFPSLIVASDNLYCNEIMADGKVWDLSKIGGPRSVMDSNNTTYTIDICDSLEESDNVPKEQCPEGTRGKL
jgi:hypothetical protein